MQLKPYIVAALVSASLLLMGRAPARAHIVVTSNIIHFVRGGPRHDDVIVHNAGDERAYVLVEPREVLDPGTPKERRVDRPDPAELGLLVTPARMVLEPGQRQIVRVVRLAKAPVRDRVYRVSIRPVVGKVEAKDKAVKVLVGYTALVIIRPDDAEAKVYGERVGDTITFRNEGNTNALLVGGEQCDEAGGECVRLEPHRLYAGNTWELELPHGTPAEFIVVDQSGQTRVRFERP